MTKYLGIDYGRKKIGLAISDGKLAEPYRVVRFENLDQATFKILEEREKLGALELVVGVTEGEMGKEQETFAKTIGAVTFDETLSTQDAQNFSIEAGIKRSKRKNMEDAYAATIMLQNYLDSKSIR